MACLVVEASTAESLSAVMGYDTTLHLVDERAFVTFENSFADPRPDNDAMRELQRLLDEDRSSGELLLAERLLAQVSAFAPYVRARNVALSLWDREQTGVAFPEEWIGALEDHLPRLRACYPDLRLPRQFTANCTTGIFIPAAHVPKAAAFVEQAVAALPPGDVSHLRDLRKVLRVAAEHGLGYWEGTEIAVVARPPKAELLAAVVPPYVRIADNPFPTAFRPHAREDERMVIRERGVTLRIDTARFPPDVDVEAEISLAAAYTPWGTDLVVDDEHRSMPFEFRGPDRRGKVIHLPFDVDSLRRVAGGVVAIPDRSREGAVPHLITKTIVGKRKATPLSVPPTGVREDAGAVIPFADGSFLLVWNETPYRCARGKVTPLGGSLGYVDDVKGAVTMDDGTIVGAFGGGLLRIATDGTRTPIAGFSNPYEVAPGLDGSVVVRDAHDGLAAKVWWPAHGGLTYVSLEAVGVDRDPTLCFLAVRDRLLVFACDENLHAVPWDVIVAMRRVSQ